jgi:DNA-binding transcriptional ArsR family regulator
VVAPGRDDEQLMEQGRALGSPTRYAIFRYVERSGSPVGVAELTAHFGLNHNAIRQHMAKLREARLVVEEQLGITERARGSYTVEGLVVLPPERAGCRIRIAATHSAA